MVPPHGRGYRYPHKSVKWPSYKGNSISKNPVMGSNVQMHATRTVGFGKNAVNALRARLRVVSNSKRSKAREKKNGKIICSNKLF